LNNDDMGSEEALHENDVSSGQENPCSRSTCGEVRNGRLLSKQALDRKSMNGGTTHHMGEDSAELKGCCMHCRGGSEGQYDYEADDHRTHGRSRNSMHETVFSAECNKSAAGCSCRLQQQSWVASKVGGATSDEGGEIAGGEGGVASKERKGLLAEVDDLMLTSGSPPVDLLIRTSGETRLSDFMTWQCRAALMCWVPVLWPAFSIVHLASCILQWQRQLRALGWIRKALSDADAALERVAL
jgi:hypothetical protein